MSRKRARLTNPTTVSYKRRSQIDTTTATGQCELWLERINRFQQKTDLKKRQDAAKAVLPLIDGTYAHGAGVESEQVYLNEALPALESVIFGTLPGIPPSMVEPRTRDQEVVARKVGALIDATLTSGLCRALPNILLSEWDEINFGLGVLKCSLHVEEYDEQIRVPSDPEYLIPHQQAAMEENLAPQLAKVLETDDDLIHIEINSQSPELLENGHIDQHRERLGRRRVTYPVIRRVNPECFAYDPDAPEWEERGWEAECCDELVSSLEKIPGIRNLNPDNCPPIDEFGNVEAQYKEGEKNDFDYERTRVRVWKVHDRLNHSYLILPYDYVTGRKPLLERDWPYEGMDVYKPIVHRPWPGRIHGIPTIQLLKPIVRELTFTNAAIRRHNRRAASAKTIFPKGAATAEFTSQLSDPSLSYAEGPAQAVALMKEFKFPSVPAELLQYRETLLSELRRMLGSDAMYQGGDAPKVVSATEASLRGAYQEARLERRKGQVSEVLTWAARTVALMYRNFAQEDLPVRMNTDTGVEVVTLDPGSIPEDLVISLDISAALPGKEQRDIEQAVKFTEILTQLLPGMFNPVEVVKFIGQRMGIRDPEKFVALAPNPMAQPLQPGPSMGRSTGDAAAAQLAGQPV